MTGIFVVAGHHSRGVVGEPARTLCNQYFGRHSTVRHPAHTRTKPDGGTMSDATRKWGRRFLWLLPVLFAVYFFVKLVDLAWYRFQIPDGFQANWSGKWETQYYGRMSGNLLVRLPDPLPENEDFKAEALVYYPIYCGWRTGQFVKMDFVGHFSPDDPASAGRSTNRIPGGGGKLKFKSTIGNQTVEYVAIINEHQNRVVGSYLSKSPHDIGYFAISYP
jgi:hypothetical protein